jgi:signal transduction histidine kinase
MNRKAESLTRAPYPDPDGGLEFTTHLQRMRDQERGDLARELHDELGALLTCAKLDLAVLKLRLAGASPDITRRLQSLGDTINSGIAFSRRVVDGLHPSSLANLGLTASLEIQAREFGQHTGIAVALDLHEVALDEATQLTVYRVVQESLNNTSKYAQARGVWIAVAGRGPEVVLSVRDDGSGFDTAAGGTASHGLAGMRHRVEACGGRLTVTSSPGSGTVIMAVLPGNRTH